MNLLVHIPLACFCLLTHYTLNAQKIIKTGIILNKTDSIPINNAHIINFNSNTGAKSNEHGEFAVLAGKNDTLIISYIGFKSLRIISSKISGYIYMEREVYSLESYTVLPYKNFKEFKNAFIKLEFPDTAKNKLNMSFSLSGEELKSYEPISSGLVLRGGITALAAHFNKRIQDKKKYEKLLANDKYQAFLATKFNLRLINRVTTLDDAKLIESFMEYCDFSNEFIEFSSEYVIIDRIFECYAEYNSLSSVSR